MSSESDQCLLLLTEPDNRKHLYFQQDGICFDLTYLQLIRHPTMESGAITSRIQQAAKSRNTSVREIGKLLKRGERISW